MRPTHIRDLNMKQYENSFLQERFRKQKERVGKDTNTYPIKSRSSEGNTRKPYAVQAMKKCIVSLLFLCSYIAAYAYDFETDGIYYNIISEKSKTCEVTYRDTLYECYHGDVVIPDRVLYNNKEYKTIGIGDCAFRESYRALSSVEIPNSIEYIGQLAFSNCFSIKELYIPKSVIRIDKTAFYAMDEMTTIRVDTSNINYSDLNGMLFTKDKTTLIAIPFKKYEIIIPEATNRIMGGAYDILCSGKRRLTIKSMQVITIENYPAWRDYGNMKCLIKVPKSMVEKYKQSKEWCHFKIKGY